MKNIKKNGKWIWHPTHNMSDGYALFRDEFSCSKSASLKISVDGNYEAYVNGALAAFGQYTDFPYHKVFDEIDLTPFVRAGENALLIRVWHIGEGGSMSYYPDDAGLFYEVSEEGTMLAVSDESTLCAIDPCYVSGRKHLITNQLGFTYRFDARGAEGEPEYIPAVPAPERPLYPRPIKKLVIAKRLKGVLINEEKRIYDLGCETAGYLRLKMRAERGAEVTVAYGEHLADGQVRQLVGGRDFSVSFIGNGKRVEFSNYMRRLGCRYLQVKCSAPVEIDEIAIDEAEYPLREIPFDAGDPLCQKIYDTAVRTLRLCMHEHYEDCPWREQALYALDSRNQMLCGFYAFGETVFPRASLKLFALEKRDDGQISICAPSGARLCIPFFSLVYCVEMCEYAEYTGDHTLLEEEYARVREVLDTFLHREQEDGLIVSYYGDADYWNFYEWSPDLEGTCLAPDTRRVELALNAYLSFALGRVAKAVKKLGFTDDAARYENAAKVLNEAINKRFYRSEERLYINHDGGLYSEVGNAFAILCGAAQGDTAKNICTRIVEGTVSTKATLSMLCYIYDALLLTDAKYADYILKKIETDFGYMLDQGATSFWETIKGESDFENAGSLCHGWSALPVYYYHRLLK